MKAVLCFLLLLGSPLFADDALLSFEQRILQSDGVAGDEFGGVIALSGTTLAVGARLDDSAAGSDAGSVSIFIRTGDIWNLQAKLVPADAAAGDRFGSAVALAGDTLIVGSTHDDASGSVLNSGSAYVFTRTGNAWTQQAKLTATDAATDDHFGHSVALSGETLLAGANGKSAGTGAAYVFVRSGSAWSQQAKLTSPEAGQHDRFGGAVALDGDLAAIGAESHDSGGLANSGRVFRFRRVGSSWTEEASWFATDPVTDGFFGSSVVLQGSKAIVGATGANDFAGAAYVFRYQNGSWGAAEKLDAEDEGGLAYDAFGGSVVMKNERVLIGAFRSVEEGTSGKMIYDAGSSWLYEDDGMSFLRMNRSASIHRSSQGEFGRSVAIDGDDVVVAEPGGGAKAGGAYSFRVVVDPTEPERWRHTYFSTVEEAGDASDDADPDGDGVVNLLERAFSLHPTRSGGVVPITSSESGGLPVALWSGNGGESGFFRLEYLRRTSATDHGLVYAPQFSGSLGSDAESGWAAPGGNESVTPINALWERVIVTDDPPAGARARFGRVKVTAP